MNEREAIRQGVEQAVEEMGVTELVRIVRDLAQSATGWDANDIVGCMFCSNEFNDIAHTERPGAHRSDCLWRRAREWVEAHT
jgi:hypothetical protein